MLRLSRYTKNLRVAKNVGIKKGVVSGLGMGIIWVIAFGIIGFAFWYGRELVRDGTVSAGFIIQVSGTAGNWSGTGPSHPALCSR